LARILAENPSAGAQRIGIYRVLAGSGEQTNPLMSVVGIGRSVRLSNSR